MLIPKIVLPLSDLKKSFALQIAQTQHIDVTPDDLEIKAIVTDPNDVDSYKVMAFDELQIQLKNES